MQKVKVAPFFIIGISIRSSNIKDQVAIEMGALWERFMTENILDKIPNKTDTTIYCVYTDYEGDHTQPYTAILGCKVQSLDQIPKNMVGKSFMGGNYIKTQAKGDIMKGIIAEKWAGIWAMKLDRVYTADFEVYGEKAQNPSNAEVDFLIAIN